MDRAGPTIGQYTDNPLERVISHRKLVAAVFPQAVTAAMTDYPGVVIEDEEEIFHCAASQGMLLFVLALLREGRLSCDTPDRFGRTPLHWAAEQGHRNVVLALLRAEACVDPRDQHQITPIMLAASRGHEEVIEVLLQFRAGESDRSRLNRLRNGIGHRRSTALHCAAAGGHVRLVGTLLQAGFDWSQLNEAGLTPAELSARAPEPKSLAIAHLPLRGSIGGRLVHAYVNRGVEDVDIVSKLVQGGAFLDWQDEAGDSPLHRAAHFSHAEIVCVLLQAGAYPNILNRCGVSPLHVAAYTGCEEIAADLIESGADTGLLAVSGHSPLHTAVVHNKVDVVRLMLDAGGSMEQRDAVHGQTALSLACRACPALMVRELVEAGADVESRCSAGLSPLHWACRFNNTVSVEVLLNAGADPCAVDQAARDAVAASSSSSGTSVSMPIAIDVIGLGFFRYSMNDSTHPLDGDLVGLGAGRMDIAATKRTELALRDAKQERSWRRRGWLIILKDRLAAVENVGARGERGAVYRCRCSCLTCPASISSRLVDTIVDNPPRARLKGAISDVVRAGSRHPQDTRSDEPSSVSKRLRNVDGVSMVASGTRDNLAACLPDVVGASLGLATVEVGLFRRVVRYI